MWHGDQFQPSFCFLKKLYKWSGRILESKSIRAIFQKKGKKKGKKNVKMGQKRATYLKI